MRKDKRLKHAHHNEEVSDIINGHKDYPDWVITSAFYSALHFVSYKIFPLDDVDASGKKVIFLSLDDYYNSHEKIKSKHQTLADLVYNEIAKISPDYDWLMDICLTARYKDYEQSPNDANRAIQLLKKIKTECLA